MQFGGGGAVSSSWTDAKVVDRRHGSDANTISGRSRRGDRLEWRIEKIGSLNLTVYDLDAAPAPAGSLRLLFPFDPKVTSTTVLPADWLDDGTFRLPAVLNAPDWGPMLLAESKGRPIVGRLEGSRPEKVVDLILEFPDVAADRPVALTLTPLLLPPPVGLPDDSLPLWLAARRGWLNARQPCTRGATRASPSARRRACSATTSSATPQAARSGSTPTSLPLPMAPGSR